MLTIRSACSHILEFIASNYNNTNNNNNKERRKKKPTTVYHINNTKQIRKRNGIFRRGGKKEIDGTHHSRLQINTYGIDDLQATHERHSLTHTQTQRIYISKHTPIIKIFIKKAAYYSRISTHANMYVRVCTCL